MYGLATVFSGGTVYPSAPANRPRGLIGGIRFHREGTPCLQQRPAWRHGHGTLHEHGHPTWLPANATLSKFAGTVCATLWTEGSQLLAVTDTIVSTITGTSGVVTVNK